MMNIIIVSKMLGSPKKIRLGDPKVAAGIGGTVLAMVGLAFGAGFATRGADGASSTEVARLKAELQAQRAEVTTAREDAQREINAVAARVGELQAQSNRLNALGERLTHDAKIGGDEFNFDKVPGVGDDEKVEDIPAKDLLKGLNEHLKLEFRASHEYLAMSIWLNEHDLPGFATWMRKQSGDELLHAQRIIDHLVERDQKVVLPAIAAPPLVWKSAEALCEHVLKNEQEVTASINELYAMAEKAKDRPGVVMLQWFVTEQMEEEAAARAVLGRIRLAGNTGVGLLMIDQELAGGSVPGMPVSPTAAAN